MTAEDLLNILEQRQLIASSMLASLRKQVAGAAKPIAPASVIKLLVDKQQLTPGQAEQLLRTATNGPAAASAPKAPAAPTGNKPAAPAANKPAAPLSLEEEMGLAPSKSTISAVVKPAAPQTIKPAPQPAQAMSLEEELGLAPSPSPGQRMQSPKVATAPTAKVAPAKLVQSAPMSLEDELGLTTESAGPANPTAAQQLAASPKPGAANTKALATGSKPSASVANPAAAKAAVGKPTAAPSKPAAAARGAAADLGLGDDLYSDLGSGPGLFDEGLLGAAAESSAGPLDMPSDDPLSSAVTASAAVAPAVARTAPPKRWTKILKLVAATLGVMLLVAGIAAAVLLRPTGDPEFQAAESDYKAESWAAAVGKYNDLLRNYPSQRHAGAARVHRGLAQLRADLGERPQWPRVLQTAETVLPDIESEAEFQELHADLAGILPDMADALARSADETDDPKEIERRVAEARRALALATDSRYLPPADRPWQRLRQIDDRLAVLMRDVDRPKELAKAVEEIRQATAKPDPAAGFDLRDKLVERFPELAANDTLQTALAELTAAEKALVKPGGEKPRPAVREERKTPIKGWTTIVARRMPAAASEPGMPALVAFEGALYALDSANGKLLWRRYIGAPPGAAAVILGDERAADRDALVVDASDHDLLRVDAATGRIKWRQALEKPLTGPPAIAGAAAYLTTRAGVMHRVDLKSGELTKSTTLPAPPVGSPAASSDGKHVFQLGARGELFTLAADDLSCAGVLYLGIENGGLAYPPLVAGRYVVVVDDYGLHESALRVIALDAQGLPAEVVSVVPIAGRIAAAPVVIGNYVIVVNESGTVVSLEITGNRDSPLKKTSEAEGESPAAEWFLAESGAQFWVSGAGCRSFELQKGRLTPRGKPIASETFDASPTVVGKSIVGLYRQPGQRGPGPGSGERGAVAFASSLSGSRLWEVELGDVSAEIAADATADALAALGLATVNGDGRETKIDLTQRSGWQTLESFTAGIRLPNQKWLWWRPSPAHGSVLFDPTRGPTRVTLPVEPAVTPVALGGGLLVPAADGALMLVDPASGKSLATAFRPRVIGGETVRWTAPALNAKGTEAFIADDQPTLYEVGVQKDPQPQLSKIAGAELDAPVVAGPVVAGGVVYLVTRDGMLRAYGAAGLKPAGEWKLSSRFVTWMQPAGDLVLLASGDELVGCSAGKKLMWKSPLAGKQPCGNPIATEFGIVVAATDGHVIRFDAATGKEAAKIDLGQPLVAGPTINGKACTATAADRCLLEFAIP